MLVRVNIGRKWRLKIFLLVYIFHVNIPRKNIGIKKLPSEIFLVSISFFKRGFIYWYQFSCDNVTSKKHYFCFIIRRLTLEAPTTENGHTQTIRWPLRTNCLSVFDHFVVPTLKVLTLNLSKHIVPNNLSTMLENYYLNWRDDIDSVMFYRGNAFFVKCILTNCLLQHSGLPAPSLKVMRRLKAEISNKSKTIEPVRNFDVLKKLSIRSYTLRNPAIWVAASIDLNKSI